MGISQQLYKEAKKIIPGGTQLLSKRAESILPELWPAYYRKAKGCVVWDLDGNRYIDMSYMGIGSCILGYADKDVDAAVKNAIINGSMSTLNCPEEVELAKLLCKIHPWANMVRYARTGGEAMAIAVRITRTKTNKDLILFCGYHGWHDWYLSANLASEKVLEGHLLPGLSPKGVPAGLKGTAIPFNYNDIDQFKHLVKKYKGSIAAVVMEPIRNFYPENNFLETIREITDKENIVFVFDEITSGWRSYLGGIHLKFKVYPDICVFAKGMSNGYPMAAIIGRKEVMSFAEDTFISSTYWTERVGLAAALATIKKFKKEKIARYLIKTGKIVQNAWKASAKKHNLSINVFGIYSLGHFTFNYDKALVLKTLFSQLMLEKGFLATTALYVSYAHTDKYLDKYLEAVDDSFKFISEAIKKDDPEKYLKGPVCVSGFKRLN